MQTRLIKALSHKKARVYLQFLVVKVAQKQSLVTT